MYRALHVQAPAYMKELMQQFNTSRNLRFLDQMLLAVPRSGLKTKGDYAFEVVPLKL